MRLSPSTKGRKVSGIFLSVLFKYLDFFSQNFYPFLFIKEKTGASPGNISVQIDKLSEAGYIKVEKGFIGKRTRTVCKLTEEGGNAFAEYVEAIKSYLEAK